MQEVVKCFSNTGYAAAYYAIEISNLEYHYLKVCSVVVGKILLYYYLYSGLSVLKMAAYLA